MVCSANLTRMSYAARYVSLALFVPAATIAGVAVAAAHGAHALYWLAPATVLAVALCSGRAHRALRTQAPPCARGARRVVGGGWSFYLQRRGPRAAVRRVEAGPAGGEWWHAGTDIAAVQRALRARDRTLASHPSVLSSTLGGWIFTNAHGSGGTLWTPQFARVRLHDRRTGGTLEAHPKAFFGSGVSEEAQSRYTILAVQVHSVDDVLCCRRAFRLRDRADAVRFLRTASYLRLAFVGARGTMCLLWTPATEGEQATIAHRDSHFLSRLSLWVQADVLSLWQQPATDEAWFAWPVEPQESFTSLVRLSSANDFAPAPSLLLGWLAFGYRNFELFVDVAAVDAPLIVRLCAALEESMARARGRCELRCGRTRLLLDFALPNRADAAAVCRDVRAVVGAATIRLHKGKAQLPSEAYAPSVGV